MLFGFTEAKLSTPFDYKITGMEIVDFGLDFKDIELILDVRVTESVGTIEISFDREFFDSRYLEVDDQFTIIADGDLVYYDELLTNSQGRTLKFNLISGTEQVEIFGTHLKGITSEIPQPKAQISPQIVTDDPSDKITELLDENQKLGAENKVLKDENKKLDSRIFELENLISALEFQVSNLSAIVTEQIKVIYNWVIGSSI